MADNLTPITSDQLSKVTTAQDTDLVTLGINGNFVSMTLANLKEVLGINALNTKISFEKYDVVDPAILEVDKNVIGYINDGNTSAQYLFVQISNGVFTSRLIFRSGDPSAIGLMTCFTSNGFGDRNWTWFNAS